MDVDPSKTYTKSWVVDFFHNFPHIDFRFTIVNSTFDPNGEAYLQALGFWALIPVAVCFLLWLVFLIYFIFRCCQHQRKAKGRPSSCLRVFTAFLIIIGAGLVGFGLYENEIAHQGIDNVRSHRHDVNKILTNASDRVTTLDELAEDISTSLSNALKLAAENITNTTIRTQALQLINEINQDAVNARSYLDRIEIEETDDGALDTVFDIEFYRWMVTIVIFSVYIFIFLLSLIGLIVRSKGTLVTSVVLAVICSFSVWLSTGFYLSTSVAAGDLCTDPDAYFIGLARGSTAEAAMVAYIKCTDSSQPYVKDIQDALNSVAQAIVALNQTAKLAQPYNIPEMDRIVAEMNTDLQFSSGNLSLLLHSVGTCISIHSHYVAGVNSACTTSIYGLAYLAVICCLLAVVCTILILCISCVWRQYTKQRLQSECVTVDDKDPFLPRPPPYETDYGTMGQSSPSPWLERGALQHGGAVSNEDQVMTLMYQHPYPMDDSPPPAYHPGQFVQRYAESAPTPGSVRPYSVK